MGIRVDEFDLTRHELAVATMAVVPSSIEVGSCGDTEFKHRVHSVKSFSLSYFSRDLFNRYISK